LKHCSVVASVELQMRKLKRPLCAAVIATCSSTMSPS
jgi:hypothetical protein